jgi:hypothetical protein
MTDIKIGDRLQFDGKKTTWLVRDKAKNGISLATCSIFGQIYYTLIDQTAGVRGAMNVLGGGLGIETTKGDDPEIAAAIEMIDDGGFEISRRRSCPLNITGHKTA